MRLVMFDLDGTLLDTAGEIAQSVNRTLRDFHRPQVSQDQVRDWIGYGTGWLMRRAWTEVAGEPNEQEWPEVMQRFMHHYYECAGTDSRPYPDVLEALAELKRIGVYRAIVTNKESRFTERILDEHGIAEWFDLVVSGDTYPVKKPDPAVLYNCMHELGASPSHCLLVGDSSIDVATAKAAGVACWAVPYGYNMGAPIEDAQPDRVVASLKEVPDFFKGIA